jgi:hypothetical protein
MTASLLSAELFALRNAKYRKGFYSITNYYLLVLICYLLFPSIFNFSSNPVNSYTVNL